MRAMLYALRVFAKFQTGFVTASARFVQDRLVCQELIKEMAQSHSLDSKHLKGVSL